jgi:hypothetical protein
VIIFHGLHGKQFCAIFNFINYNIIIIIIIITFIIIIVIISIIVKIIILIIKVYADQITHQDNQTVTLDDIIQNAGTLAENARGKSPRLVSSRTSDEGRRTRKAARALILTGIQSHTSAALAFCSAAICAATACTRHQFS